MLFEEILFNEKLNSRRLRVSCFANNSFYAWDEADETCIFLDAFDDENVETDERGYFFFDPEESTQILDNLCFSLVGSQTKISHLVALWPFFEKTDDSFFAVHLKWDYQRRRHFWKRHFGCFRYFFKTMFTTFLIQYFICFTLVGVGYFCFLTSDKKAIRVVVSNTNDLLFIPPEHVFVGCRPPNGDNPDAVSFFFFSCNYNLLRNYTKTVRDSVRFNIYEYQGLLYSSERKIKKITKRKQK